MPGDVSQPLPLFDPQAILAALDRHAGTDGYPDLARPTESFAFLTGGIEVRVANLERVIASKRASDRPKDRDAVPRLEALLRRRAEP